VVWAFGAYPPGFLARASQDLVRSQATVLGWVPLGSQLRAGLA